MTDRLSRQYDDFAPHFESTLAALDYAAPATLTAQILAIRASFGRILDLGCGTGLAAEAFRGQSIDGVDCSQNMLELARAKTLYKTLHHADMHDVLAANESTYDLIIAADVLIYLADLTRVFTLAATALKQNGFLAFTVEHLREGDTIFDGQRYAHSAAHVRQALAGAKLELISEKTGFLRNEADTALDGGYYIAIRR